MQTQGGGDQENPPRKQKQSPSPPSAPSSAQGKAQTGSSQTALAGRPALPTEAGIALGSLRHLGEGSTRARSSLETDGFKERLLMGRRRRASIFVMKINIPSLSGHLLPTHPESKPVG